MKETKTNTTKISELSRAVMEIAWYFGPKGPDGRCCRDLSMPEFLALESVVSTHDCAVQSVGRTLGFTKSGATRIVNRLEKKGYVRKVRSRDDGRVCCLALTAGGKNILRDVDRRYADSLDQLLSRMSAREKQQAETTLLAIASHLKS